MILHSLSCTNGIQVVLDLMTICLAIDQSYRAEKTSYSNDRSSYLQLLHSPLGHLIKIWALSNRYAFVTVVMSQDHVSTICGLPRWFPTRKASGESQICLTTA